MLDFALIVVSFLIAVVLVAAAVAAITRIFKGWSKPEFVQDEMDELEEDDASFLDDNVVNGEEPEEWPDAPKRVEIEVNGEKFSEIFVPVDASLDDIIYAVKVLESDFLFDKKYEIIARENKVNIRIKDQANAAS